MGVELYCGYYPKKCKDKDVLPYLLIYEICSSFNGKHFERQFYDNCREFAEYFKESECYVFDDAEKLFAFAGKDETPDGVAELISVGYREDSVFIVWIR